MDEETETSASCLVSPLHSCIAQINLSVCFGDMTAPACASAPLSAGATFILSQVTHHVVCSGTQACVTETGIHILFIYFLGARLMSLSVSMSLFGRVQ